MHAFDGGSAYDSMLPTICSCRTNGIQTKLFLAFLAHKLQGTVLVEQDRERAMQSYECHCEGYVPNTVGQMRRRFIMMIGRSLYNAFLKI